MPDPFVLSFVPGVTPAKWVGVWKERMSGTPIEVNPLPPAEALASLHSGVADVAFLRLPIDQHDLSLIPLYWEKAVVVVPKDHVLEAFDTVTLAELEDETRLAGTDAGTIELVAANVGVAVMPQSVARAHSRRDVVAKVIEDAPETRIALAWIDGNPDPLIEEFIGIVRGRTANSSRGQAAAVDVPKEATKRTPRRPPEKRRDTNPRARRKR